MKINQHHSRFLRKKQSDIAKKKSDQQSIWTLYWLHSACALLNIEATTDTVFDLACNLFEPYETKTKNIGNIYAGLTILSSVNPNKNIKDLDTIEGSNIKREIEDTIKCLKNADDTYRMYEYGETDIRSIYCAIAVSKYFELPIITPIDYIISCQSYDGGFSGTPDTESHAGFTYCAVATLTITNELQRCNLMGLIGWLVCRAENVNGRVSKESDSCYGFWIGATVKILEISGYINEELKNAIFDSLYNFVMKCEEKWGGFKNKISGSADLQHTAYALFFLSLDNKYNGFNHTIDPLLGCVVQKKCGKME